MSVSVTAEANFPKLIISLRVRFVSIWSDIASYAFLKKEVFEENCFSFTLSFNAESSFCCRMLRSKSEEVFLLRTYFRAVSPFRCLFPAGK